MIKQIVVCILLLCASVVSGRTEDSDEGFYSPNRKFVVRREIPSISDPQKRRVKIIALQPQARVIYSWLSSSKSIDVMWNQFGDMVAINDYTGNSGDNVYVFKVTERSCDNLRKPDNKSVVKALLAQFPILAPLERYSLVADHWSQHDLVLTCWVRGGEKGHVSGWEIEAGLVFSANRSSLLRFGPAKRDPTY